jgi:hypothetical protein
VERDEERFGGIATRVIKKGRLVRPIGITGVFDRPNFRGPTFDSFRLSEIGVVRRLLGLEDAAYIDCGSG